MDEEADAGQSHEEERHLRNLNMQGAFRHWRAPSPIDPLTHHPLPLPPPPPL